jgi:hypothetical protein
MPTQIQSSLKLIHFAKEKTGGAPLLSWIKMPRHSYQSLTTIEDQCLVNN